MKHSKLVLSHLSVLVVIVLFSLGLPTSALSQSSKFDSTYVKELPGYWSARAFSSYRYQHFRLTHQNMKTSDITNSIQYFQPEELNAGLGIAYKFLVLDAGISLVKSDAYENNKIILRGNLIYDKAIFGMSFQRYKGMEMKKNFYYGEEEYVREDISFTNAVLSFDYAFNNRRLSLKSAYTGDRIQLKSAGSLIAGARFSYEQINADSSIVPFQLQHFFERISLLRERNAYSGGLTIGYAYNLVIAKGLFFYNNVSPNVGIIVGTQEVGDRETNTGGYFNFSLSVQSVLGYTRERSYITIAYEDRLSRHQVDMHNFLNFRSGRIKLVLGYRFGSSIKILDDIDEKIIPKLNE